MKKFFKFLSAKLKKKPHNVFQQQYTALQNKQSKEDRVQFNKSRWVLCVVDEKGTIDKLLKHYIPGYKEPDYKNVSQIENEQIFGTLYYYHDCLIHVFSQLPTNTVMKQELCDFYRQKLQNNPPVVLGCATPQTLSQQNSLLQPVQQWQSYLQDADIHNGEFRTVLVGLEQTQGFQAYLRYCKKNQHPLWMKIDPIHSLRTQLQQFEVQRRGSLLQCESQDYLNILAFIAVLIRCVSQLRSGLVQAFIPPHQYQMTYFLSGDGKADAECSNPLLAIAQ